MTKRLDNHNKALTYKALKERMLAATLNSCVEALGFAVAADWLTFAQAVDAYVGLRAITFESHLGLAARGMDVAIHIRDAVKQVDSGEPPRINNKRAGIKS